MRTLFVFYRLAFNFNRAEKSEKAKSHPYKVCLMPYMSCSRMIVISEKNSASNFVKRILLSDEATFFSNGKVCREKVAIWRPRISDGCIALCIPLIFEFGEPGFRSNNFFFQQDTVLCSSYLDKMRIFGFTFRGDM